MCLREKESPYEGDSERNTSKQTAEEGASLTLWRCNSAPKQLLYMPAAKGHCTRARQKYGNT